MLGAIVLTNDDDPRRNMREANSGLGLVDVLAPCSARSHGVGPHVGFLDVHHDAIVDYRVYRDVGDKWELA